MDPFDPAIDVRRAVVALGPLSVSWLRNCSRRGACRTAVAAALGVSPLPHRHVHSLCTNVDMLRQELPCLAPPSVVRYRTGAAA
ncbi:hypothetical protein GS502_13535 [Rhodococcus hoagii]|nr:hypothetical protein [Prescottella equi]